MSIATNVRFLWQRLVGRVSSCPHVEEIRITAAPSARECPTCVALGDRWRALRVCTSCGEVGCCDSSKNRHARRHAEACGHPVIASTKAAEDWYWCFIDARLIDPGERAQGRHTRGSLISVDDESELGIEGFAEVALQSDDPAALR